MHAMREMSRKDFAKKISSTRGPSGEAVTVSIGITDNADHPHDLKILLEEQTLLYIKQKTKAETEPSLKLRLIRYIGFRCSVYILQMSLGQLSQWQIF